MPFDSDEYSYKKGCKNYKCKNSLKIIGDFFRKYVEINL